MKKIFALNTRLLPASRFLFVLCAFSMAFSPQSACAFALSDSVKSAALHMFSSYERPLYFAAGFLAGIATYFLATRYAKRVTLSRIRKISENAHSILESISSFRDVLTPLNADSNSTCVLNAKRAEKDLYNILTRNLAQCEYCLDMDENAQQMIKLAKLLVITTKSFAIESPLVKARMAEVAGSKIDAHHAGIYLMWKSIAKLCD